MRRPVIVMALSLLFGAVYWVLDGVYDYLTFAENLHLRLFQEPLTLADAIFRNVPPDDLLSRGMFLLACLLGGGMILFFLRRDAGARERLDAGQNGGLFMQPALYDLFPPRLEPVRIVYRLRHQEPCTGAHLLGEPHQLQRGRLGVRGCHRPQKERP